MKIIHKLTLDYLLAGLFIAAAAYFAAGVGGSAVERQVTQAAEDLVNQLVSRIDWHIGDMVDQFRAYAGTGRVRSALAASNAEFDAMPAPREFIETVDGLWVAAPAEELPPEAAELIDEGLSRDFLDVVRYYERERGFRVVGEIFVTNRYGANVAQSGKTSDYRQDDEDWWEAAMRDGICLTPLELDRSAGVYSNDLCVRVDGEGGEALGVLKVVLNMEGAIDVVRGAFERDINQARRPEAYSLLTGDGRMIFSTRQFEDFQDASVLFEAGVDGLEDAPAAATFGAEAGRIVYSYARSTDPEGPGWIVLAEHDRGVMREPVIRLRRRIWLVCLGLICLGLATGWSVARSISGRIERLHEGAEVIGRGDFDHKVATDARDEIGQLSRAFEQMARNLKTITASRDELNRQIAVREQVEASLEEALEELARSNQELEQFAYVASHDLQEPLRKVQAFGDRLRDRCGDALDERGLDYLERMLDAARRMSGLIDDLLAYARVTTRGEEFEPVDLDQVAREVVSDLETRIGEVGGTVEIEGLPTIEADPMQMRQLLQNLVGNALKFHRPDVSPVVKVRGELMAEEGGAATCRLTVEDNGIGFEPRHLERVFGVFQRLHGRAEYSGTGIGLAICRKIARRHGGEIIAESEPGAGATFAVTLPVERGAQAEH